MRSLTNPIFNFGFLLLLLLFLHSRGTTSQEVENEREFDYLMESGKGPHKWGDLRKEWAACKDGNMQSPIDLLSKRVQVVSKLGKLKKGYKSSNATLKNRGHDIMIQWAGGAGSIQVNGTDYVLTQCHWHSPSEHTINSKRYDLELHKVHLSSDLSVANRIVVVGIMYEIGRPDSFLSEVEEKMRSIADSHDEVNIGVVDPKHIKMDGNKYYRYMGSLTVPPCTEGIIWIINKKVRTVSRDQVKLMRTAVHDYAEKNARPLQPLNNREIHFYGPMD